MTAQHLTFRVGAEEYGVPVLQVQEIRGLTPITALPDMPPHMKGLMNLRGRVIPVYDLRERFGIAAPAYGKYTVIVLVQVASRVVGLVVDAVTGVLDGAEVEPVPDLGAVDASFLAGMARSGDRYTLLLDLDRLLGAELSSPRPAEAQP